MVSVAEKDIDSYHVAANKLSSHRATMQQPNAKHPTMKTAARSYLCYTITEHFVLLFTFLPLGDMTKSRTGCFREERLGSPHAPL